MKQYRHAGEVGRRSYRWYWQINLRTVDGRNRHHMVHKLVAEVFLGPCPSGMQIRHGPSGKLDNHLDNLSYGTPAENQADRERDGTVLRGNLNPQAKLTDEDVSQIRARHAAGERQIDLAREFDVSKALVSMLLSQRRRKLRS